MYYCYIYYDPSRNHEPFYVGKGKGDRAFSMSRREAHLKHRLAKMRANNTCVKIGLYAGLDEEAAFLLEGELIRKYGRRDLGLGTLVNLTDGGDGASGYIHSAERRRKISESTKGRVVRPETIEAIAAFHTGRKRSKETCEKIGVAKKGFKHSPETKRRMSERMTGATYTDERNAKVSASLTGHAVSDVTRARIREKAIERAKTTVNPMQGKKHSEATRQKLREAALRRYSK